MDKYDAELDHVMFLKKVGYDFTCSNCNAMYRKKPTSGCDCGGEVFLPTREVVRKLELRLA